LEEIMRSRPLPTVLSDVRSLVLAGLLVTSLAACAGAPDEDTAADSPSTRTSTSTSESATTPSATAAPAYPVDITSCGRTTTITAQPQHAVTLNQGATEVALALGVQDQLAGTAYLDDAVPEKWKAAYDSVPVLSKEYPSREKLLAVQPDFLYASYGSAYDAKAVGTQDELQQQGIASYVSPFGCDDKAQRPETSFDSVWDEVDSVAAAFGVPERAEELRTEQQATLDTLSEAKAADGLTVVWWDSGTKAPFVGAGQGGPALVMQAVGATNAFAGLEGSWADSTWEDVVAADPDVIVLVDASWDTAKDKRTYLDKDPVLSQLTAVKEKHLVTVPFSESTAGVRLVDGAQALADQIAALGLS
jgi:iron complex transport system substrate-binding protein